MAVSLVLPVVGSVARKAADELVRTVTRMWGIDADRDKLERRLLAVQCLLADAEVKSETNLAVRRWMKDLKAATYRADDVMDHFQYEALRRKAQCHCSITSKVLSHFTLENPLLFRLKASRELKDVLRKIDDLVEEMNKFGLVEHAEVPQILYRQTHSLLDESEEIYGRDDHKEELVQLLQDQQHQQKVQVLPIIGMGGLGKTTLAKMVYNDIRVHKHFELKMWHCVSDNFEAPSLLRSVIELATKDRCCLPENIELLWGTLRDVIGRKRFLLILDDVWNEEQCKWEDHLKPILCSSIGGSGSMIIVTSRSQRVASIMGTIPPCELACLSEDDSWNLFSRKAFCKGVQKREEFVTMGRRIVHKCKGLPLALKTMGGLMSSKQQVQEWAAIVDCNISDTIQGKDEVMSVLKLSYKNLSSEMKQCFAFSAIFPKDYQMEKDVLIQLWMANNFLHAEGMMDLTQKGEFIFKELVWRSFLQEVKESSISGNQRIVCKMHDLMHDLAKDVTEEYASAEELFQENVSIKCVHHIEISYPFELREIEGLLKRATSLRTLLTESSYKDLKDLKLKSVRALRCTEPSHSLVRYSKLLQYLDLSESKIVRLPDSICMLYNLQSLRLDRCYGLQYLPEGMATGLRMLRHIYLLECRNLEEMPPKLSLLHNLHTLTRYVVGTKDGCGIEELKDLQQLGNRLELCELRKVKSGSKVNLHEKHNLRELLLEWSDTSDILTNNDINNEEETLKSLVPPVELKVLEVHGYHGLKISQWMRDPQMFRCLKTLRISDCPRFKVIPLICLSPSLETLHLAHMENLTTLCESVDVESVDVEVAGHIKCAKTFPRLKSMTLNNLPNLERWTEEPRNLTIFPQLEELEVAGCQKLITLPKVPLLKHLSCRVAMQMIHPNTYNIEGFVPTMSMPLANLSSLVKLDIALLANVDLSAEEQQGKNPNTLEELQYLNVTGDDAFSSIFNIHKLELGLAFCWVHVEKLRISCVHNTVRWPMEELQYLPGLRSLWIWACNKLGEQGLSSEAILPLPVLKELIIEQCDCLLEIPQLPQSLETLKIYNCSRLVRLPSNLGNLANLRDHAMYNCGALRVLPDGMDGLTSLEELTIVSCPGIEEFPRGLFQWIPTLKYLNIEKCPILERRCREGGEYFDLVSSILKTHIGAAVEPELQEIKRPAKSCLKFWDSS